MPRRRRIGLTALAVAGVLAVTLWLQAPVRDWLNTPRDAITSSPGLAALFSRAPTTLRDGGRACLSPVTFAADTGRVRIRLEVPTRVPPTVAAVAEGPGYRSSGEVPPLKPRARGTAEILLRPPGREVADGRLCLVNRGPSPVTLIGTDEGRSLTPTELRVNGRLVRGREVEAVLLTTNPTALRYREGDLVERASSLGGGLLPEWLLWPVLLLLCGLPLVVAVLFGWSVWRSTAPPAEPAA